MRVDIPTLSAPETAIVLYARLGSLRAWPDFLADCIRLKTHLYGLVLMPCGRKRDGRAFRPMYGVAEVQKFITDIKVKVPSAGRTPVKSTVLSIDTGMGWKLNKFAQDGSPIAISRIAGFAAHGHAH